MGSAITVVLSDYTSSGDSTSTTAPLTYFVCGNARGDTDEPPAALRGDELALGIRFKDDLRDSVPSTQLYYTSDGAAASATDAAGRDALSSALLTRGGFREHTDGNRITTTRGDSLEVVYGNYKLVVLGRITDAFDPAGRGGLGQTNDSTVNSTLAHTGLDASGGLLTDETSAGGKIVSATWDDGAEDGSWCTIEQTDDGDKRVVYRGRLQRTFFGPTKRLYVGRGTDAVAIDSGSDTARAHPAERPKVERSTFARGVVHRERYNRRSQSISARSIEEELVVGESSVRAEVFHKRSELMGVCAFREELTADRIARTVEFGTTRVRTEIGAIRTDTHAIGYHQTLRSGSRYNIWVKGVDVRVDAPINTSLKLGMDSAYRFCPSVDFTQGASVRLHLTLDVLAPINKLITHWKGEKAYVFDGDTVVIKVSNSAISNTV